MLTIPFEPSPSNSSSPSTSPYLSYHALDTPLSSPCSSPHPFLLPPPSLGGRSRSPSNASTCSWSTVHSVGSAPSSPIERQLSESSITEHTAKQLAAAAALVQPSRFTPASEPAIVKRKRGRPVNSTKRQSKEHFTFMTPTVCDVKRTNMPLSPSPQPSTSTDPHLAQDDDDKSVLLLWHDPQHARLSAYHNMNTFTNTRMDETLTMPKKKRGRKPKTQLAGNSCFVWRDLTARRGVNRNKVKKPSPTRPRLAPKLVSPSPSPSPSPCPSPAILSVSSPVPSLSLTTCDGKSEQEDIVGWTKGLSLNDP
ncbi:hypothetical protein DM01DRAFT_309687 [Hesseltinella vesiculosa]|uniref:Uncharacterized protein n=1 Tax=Hesseltinella vesiculosa TaxID=101127 RepID=A0A1X2G858_9FUNG|nr:hypothetical protein DM01DRAFT_309687 [Hesseltinella vesiculosa]